MTVHSCAAARQMRDHIDAQLKEVQATRPAPPQDPMAVMKRLKYRLARQRKRLGRRQEAQRRSIGRE